MREIDWEDKFKSLEDEVKSLRGDVKKCEKIIVLLYNRLEVVKNVVLNPD